MFCIKLYYLTANRVKIGMRCEAPTTGGLYGDMPMTDECGYRAKPWRSTAPLSFTSHWREQLWGWVMTSALRRRQPFLKSLLLAVQVIKKFSVSRKS